MRASGAPSASTLARLRPRAAGPARRRARTRLGIARSGPSPRSRRRRGAMSGRRGKALLECPVPGDWLSWLERVSDKDEVRGSSRSPIPGRRLTHRRGRLDQRRLSDRRIRCEYGLAFADTGHRGTRCRAYARRSPTRPGVLATAYPFVRLHAVGVHGVNSLPLGKEDPDRCRPARTPVFTNEQRARRSTTTSPRTASRLTQTGRVRILTGHEHLAPREAQNPRPEHGALDDVEVRRKLVDARYLEASNRPRRPSMLRRVPAWCRSTTCRPP